MKASAPVPIRHHRLKLPQGSLFWHEVGQGSAVVFLHGTWQDSGQWYPIIEQLSSDFHCIAPDLLGFGESSAALAPYSIALEVEILDALLARLRVQKVYLVGHALGAWVAFALAQHYPDRVLGILAIEPEGFATPALAGRWKMDRWLVAPWSPLGWLLRCMAPLASRLAAAGQFHRWRHRRQRLRHAPAACQILFRRRWAEITAELIGAQPSPLAVPVVVGEFEEATSTARQLTQACLDSFPQAKHQIFPTASISAEEAQAAVTAAVIALTELADSGVTDNGVTDNGLDSDPDAASPLLKVRR